MASALEKLRQAVLHRFLKRTSASHMCRSSMRVWARRLRSMCEDGLLVPGSSRRRFTRGPGRERPILSFSLRSSAYLCDLCVEIIFTAENAEIRRGPQRKTPELEISIKKIRMEEPWRTSRKTCTTAKIMNG